MDETFETGFFFFYFDIATVTTSSLTLSIRKLNARHSPNVQIDIVRGQSELMKRMKQDIIEKGNHNRKEL